MKNNKNISSCSKFSRKYWILINLELWYQTFLINLKILKIYKDKTSSNSYISFVNLE